jgi:DNA-binding NtrC family response regulator
MRLHEIIREAIEDAVARNGGNKVDAAKELGIGKTTVYRWMADYGRKRRKPRKKSAKKSKAKGRRR